MLRQLVWMRTSQLLRPRDVFVISSSQASSFTGFWGKEKCGSSKPPVKASGGAAPQLTQRKSAKGQNDVTCQDASKIIPCRHPRAIKLGAKIPSELVLYERSPCNPVRVRSLVEGKNTLFVGIPGAFTPVCTKKHIPGYVTNASVAASKGIDELICVSVNDPFVMDAYAKSLKSDGKIRMMADPDGSFTKALGMDLDEFQEDFGRPNRSRRYAIFAQCGKVQKVFEEPSGTSRFYANYTTAGSVLKELEGFLGLSLRPSWGLADTGKKTIGFFRRTVENIDMKQRKTQCQTTRPPSQTIRPPSQATRPPSQKSV